MGEPSQGQQDAIASEMLPQPNATLNVRLVATDDFVRDVSIREPKSTSGNPLVVFPVSVNSPLLWFHKTNLD